MKIGFIEPINLNEKLIEQQIKETKGITELSESSDHSDILVCHLDVDSFFPCSEVGSKGMALRHLRKHANWV